MERPTARDLSQAALRLPPGHTPPTPRLAATVVLVRDGQAGLEVYAQHRVNSMPTFPSATVFPGGGVDRGDYLSSAMHTALWQGPSPEQWSHRLGVTPSHAAAIVTAAVRELFEETGTLIAFDGTQELLRRADRFHQQRLALEAKQLGFGDFLHTQQLQIASSLLHPFARWIGPPGAARSFDAFSFVVVAPREQRPDAVSGETTTAGWYRPQELLARWAEGTVQLVLPTWSKLRVLSAVDSVAALCATLPEVDMEPIVDKPECNSYFGRVISDA
ncbi:MULTISPECIES: NUDIX hydrolase [Corynebacterium]|uniref:NUDIX hydrolase n=1 Tax=Corynebacterium TaxID=1716 RepID=UPI00124D7ECB|nr:MULTISPECIES: NUDIX hydrolase [Corynebacterium]